MNALDISEGGTTIQPVQVLYTAKTHTTSGREGGGFRSSDVQRRSPVDGPGGDEHAGVGREGCGGTSR